MVDMVFLADLSVSKITSSPCLVLVSLESIKTHSLYFWSCLSFLSEIPLSVYSGCFPNPVQFEAELLFNFFVVVLPVFDMSILWVDLLQIFFVFFYTVIEGSMGASSMHLGAGLAFHL